MSAPRRPTRQRLPRSTAPRPPAALTSRLTSGRSSRTPTAALRSSASASGPSRSGSTVSVLSAPVPRRRRPCAMLARRPPPSPRARRSTRQRRSSRRPRPRPPRPPPRRRRLPRPPRLPPPPPRRRLAPSCRLTLRSRLASSRLCASQTWRRPPGVKSATSSPRLTLALTSRPATTGSASRSTPPAKHKLPATSSLAALVVSTSDTVNRGQGCSHQQEVRKQEK
mmetsp:Transcript_25053/g.57686  ORF Transcript_25053/g.57686 Transcript_25053/m.57686 type:complete len:224 (-) Transcript_25053:150-821(-)